MNFHGVLQKFLKHNIFCKSTFYGVGGGVNMVEENEFRGVD